jgi:uncharacterized protein
MPAGQAKRNGAPADWVGMPAIPAPASAAWRHRDARAGFEAVFIAPDGGGARAVGSTAAVEGGEPWIVSYEIRLAADWTTRSACVASRSERGRREVRLDADGAGRWLVDGARAPALDGCLDVDLESSALTNAFPARRLGLAVGGDAEAPAAYVRALDLRVERLEQRYLRLEDAGRGSRYRYVAPAFDFACVLTYGEDGLVDDYPGIAVRVR